MSAFLISYVQRSCAANGCDLQCMLWLLGIGCKTTYPACAYAAIIEAIITHLQVHSQETTVDRTETP